MKTNWERHNPIIELPLEAVRSIVRSHDRESIVQQVNLLSGGLSHTNYRVDRVNQEPVIVRVTKNRDSLLRERNLHTRLPAPVRAPHFMHLTQWNGYGIGIVEWKNGNLLRDQFSQSSAIEMERMGQSIGEQLAAIREVPFNTYGFLDTDLAVQQEFRLTPETFKTTIDSFFSGYSSKWLPVYLIEEILSYVSTNAYLFEEDDSGARLVHGDFNGLNLLMEGTDVSAVLDWEFALSGSIYFDIGNMLRYEFLHMRSFEQGIQYGLNRNGVILTNNWKTLAKLADLVALCSLLNRPVCGENRVKDITNLIKGTIYTG
ncbi:phosphotransferase [Pseudalkalibacillus hwajinpoensis]|uniref:phosphotransferase family protein n=1 Tax=Guptibacillus hwajinpoensis TaxID=208199 RepID=UPI00325B531D